MEGAVAALGVVLLAAPGRGPQQAVGHHQVVRLVALRRRPAAARGRGHEVRRRARRARTHGAPSARGARRARAAATASARANSGPPVRAPQAGTGAPRRTRREQREQAQRRPCPARSARAIARQRRQSPPRDGDRPTAGHPEEQAPGSRRGPARGRAGRRRPRRSNPAGRAAAPLMARARILVPRGRRTPLTAPGAGPIVETGGSMKRASRSRLRAPAPAAGPTRSSCAAAGSIRARSSPSRPPLRRHGSGPGPDDACP